jgi:hypothetical protein
MKEYEELRKLIDGGSESMTHADAVDELNQMIRCCDLVDEYTCIVGRIRRIVNEAEDEEGIVDDDALSRELKNLFVIYWEAIGDSE